MNRLFVLAGLVAALLASCKPPEESNYKSIIGAVLIDPEVPLISRSVIVVAGARIRAIGQQASTPIPAGADKVDGAGKFLIAAPVTIPTTNSKVVMLSDAQREVDNGATTLEGMIADTSELDQEFLHKLRDLRVVFIPKLATIERTPQQISVARVNTKNLADAGVLIAADNPADWNALAEAGLTPAQIVAAVTRNAARAAGKEGEFGGLETGYRASVWLLRSNPLEDVAALSQVELTIEDGEWGKP
jgi:hypothetical protein